MFGDTQPRWLLIILTILREVAVNSGPIVSLLVFFTHPNFPKHFPYRVTALAGLSSNVASLFMVKGTLTRAVMSQCGSGDAHSNLRK